MSNFHSGSTILSPIGSATGLKIDQLNFILCQLLACGLGYIYSRYLSGRSFKPVHRHIIELIAGVSLTLFCFGSQIWHLLAQSVSVYFMMKLLPVKMARYFILGFVLLFLSVAHIGRMYYDYGFYSLDITGPLMIQTQKLSSLAFNLSDGDRINKGQPLRKEYHRKHAVKRYPTLLEFFSYMFYFHGLMAGPFVFMADYLRFIDDRQYETLDDEADVNEFKRRKSHILCAWREIGFHLVSLLIYAVLFFGIQPYFDPEFLLTDEYFGYGFFRRYFLMTLTMFLVRQKYYLAWTTGSLTNLFAGLGFSGFSADHHPQYHIVKNFHFSQSELGTSTKMMIDHWNVGTALWLRECVYDRMPRNFGMITVFICSAIWHGFYSGYYLTFASVAVATAAARYGRKMFRPFIINLNCQRPYDLFTAIVSMFSLNFCVLPFILLEITKGFVVWKSLYFIGPLSWVIIIVLGIFIDKRKELQKKRSSQ